MVELKLQSTDHTAFIPITQQVQEIVNDKGWKKGILTIFIPHTTAGVTIQENADPDVVWDMIYAFEKIAPWKDTKYQHGEGNTAAHVKASLVGTSAQCIVENGKILLGTWQGIFFCEFDGPRHRKAWVTFQ
jgi:secondary thiamine-phosphate synthase enzyme